MATPISCPRLPANPRCEDFNLFKRLLENYFLIAETKDSIKLPILLQALGSDGLNIFDGCPDPKTTYTEAISCLQTYFGGKTSVLIRRKTFYQSVQAEGESVTEFACRLRRSANDCDFGANLSTTLRDIFVIGVRDDRLGERLLSEDASTLTFEEALKRGEAYERARQERRTVHHGESVHAVNSSRTLKKSGNDKERSNDTCYRCGRSGHRANFSGCPAKNARCNGCQKIGHFKSVCRNTSGGKTRIAAVSADPCEDSDSDNSFVASAIFTVGKKNSMIRHIHIDNTLIKGLIDTGAVRNVIPHHLLPDLAYNSTDVTLNSFGNGKIDVLGEVSLSVRYGAKVCSAIFIVVNVPHEFALLSTELSRELGMLAEICSVNFDGRNNDLLEKYKCVFEGLGSVKNFSYEIDVDPAVEPFHCNSRPLPPAILTDVEKELQTLEEEGIIKKVTEPTDWCSPLVVVRKPNGKIRICTDLRKLNEAIKRPSFHIPNTEDLFAQISGSQYFSRLDCNSAFHQLHVSDESQPLLTFSTPSGRFCWTRMPYGIKSAPEIFQSVLFNLLRDVPRCFVFFDDILIAARSLEEHMSVLSQILEILSNNGITLNKEKCTFSKESIDFLGHTISASGIKPSAAKIAALKDMERPATKTQLRSFLGFASYIGQRFVPHFSTLSAPLWDKLTLPSEKVTWCQNSEKAFTDLKEALVNHQNLVWFDPNKKCVIQTDSSNEGLGCVLLQDDKPVAFSSRRLKPSEKRYSVIEKEFLGILFALQRFRRLILFAHCDVFTDHKPILGLIKKNLDSLPIRIQKWLMHIQSFDITLHHVPGKKNSVADALSRNPSNKVHSTAEEDADYAVCYILSSAPIDIHDVVHATKDSEILQAVVKAINANWMTVESRSLLPYYSFRDELSLKYIGDYAVVMRGKRICIPPSLVNPLLLELHEGHLGVTKMRQLAQSSFFWPGYSKDIAEFVHRCSACTVFQETIDQAPIKPFVSKCSRPGQLLSLDLTGPSSSTEGRVLLTLIDTYSRYPDVFMLDRGSTAEIIARLQRFFSLFGLPETIITDNGTPFVSAEFSSFLRSCGIAHVRSANYHPQTQGCIERFHRTLKSRIRRIRYQNDSVSFHSALQQVLLDIRSTPHAMTGQTPAKLFLARELRTKLSSLCIDTSNLSAPKRSAIKEYDKLNKKSRCVNYSEGDMILYRKGKGQTFIHKGKIVKRLGLYTYLLADENGQHRTYNQCDLKRRFEDGRSHEIALDAYEDACDRQSDSVPTCNDTPVEIPHRSPATQKRSKYNLRPPRLDPSCYRL